MKNQNLKNTNGITLIALIITIIVMLILVAVTISMAVNGGLFGYAGNASRETEASKNKELGWANLSSGMSTDDLIEKYTTGEIEEVHNWTRGTGEEIDKFSCSHCGLEVEMEDELCYEPDAVATPSIVPGTYSGMINDPYLNSRGLGIDGEQSFTQEELEWIVFGIEDKNGNGTNETLLITSKEPTDARLFLYGAAAYNNGPTIMNKICKDLYSSSVYGWSRSMKIEDLNSALGWTDTRGMYRDKDGNYHKENLKFSELPEEDRNIIIARGTNVPDGTSIENISINGYEYYVKSGCYLVDNTNPNSTEIEVTPMEIHLLYYQHWLASRGVAAFASDPTGANKCILAFGPGAVGQYSASSYSDYFRSSMYSTSNQGNDSLRPVVELLNLIPERNESNNQGSGGK